MEKGTEQRLAQQEARQAVEQQREAELRLGRRGRQAERSRTGCGRRPLMACTISVHMSHRERYTSFINLGSWVFKYSFDIAVPASDYLKDVHSV